jgi:hypothetical protein
VTDTGPEVDGQREHRKENQDEGRPGSAHVSIIPGDAQFLAHWGTGYRLIRNRCFEAKQRQARDYESWTASPPLAGVTIARRSTP